MANRFQTVAFQLGLALALLAAPLLARAAPGPAKEQLLLVADLWCPYSCEAEAIQQGYIIELCRRIFAPAGVEVIYQTVPWNRALDSTRRGLSGGVVGTAAKEAQGLVLPAEPAGYSESVFLTRADSAWNYAGPHSLEGHLLLASVGYSYGDAVDAYIRDHPESVLLGRGHDVLSSNLRLLLNRTPDILIDDASVLAYALRQRGLADQVRLAGSADDREPIYVAFKPDEQGRRWADIFSKGIRALRDSGGLAEILSAYELRDWAAARARDQRPALKNAE